MSILSKDSAPSTPLPSYVRNEPFFFPLDVPPTYSRAVSPHSMNGRTINASPSSPIPGVQSISVPTSLNTLTATPYSFQLSSLGITEVEWATFAGELSYASRLSAVQKILIGAVWLPCAIVAPGTGILAGGAVYRKLLSDNVRQDIAMGDSNEKQFREKNELCKVLDRWNEKWAKLDVEVSMEMLEGKRAQTQAVEEFLCREDGFKRKRGDLDRRGPKCGKYRPGYGPCGCYAKKSCGKKCRGGLFDVLARPVVSVIVSRGIHLAA